MSRFWLIVLFLSKCKIFNSWITTSKIITKLTCFCTKRSQLPETAFIKFSQILVWNYYTNVPRSKANTNIFLFNLICNYQTNLNFNQLVQIYMRGKHCINVQALMKTNCEKFARTITQIKISFCQRHDGEHGPLITCRIVLSTSVDGNNFSCFTLINIWWRKEIFRLGLVKSIKERQDSDRQKFSIKCFDFLTFDHESPFLPAALPFSALKHAQKDVVTELSLNTRLFNLLFYAILCTVKHVRGLVKLYVTLRRFFSKPWF